MIPRSAIGKPSERCSRPTDEDGVAPAFAAFATIFDESEDEFFDESERATATTLAAITLFEIALPKFHKHFFILCSRPSWRCPLLNPGSTGRTHRCLERGVSEQ